MSADVTSLAEYNRGVRSARAAYSREVSGGGPFTSQQVCQLAGVVYFHLNRWANAGRVTPSIDPGVGSGHVRLWSADDVLRVAVLARLTVAGLTLEAATRHLDAVLEGQPVRWAAHVELVVDVEAMRQGLQAEIRAMHEEAFGD